MAKVWVYYLPGHVPLYVIDLVQPLKTDLVDDSPVEATTNAGLLSKIQSVLKKKDATAHSISVNMNKKPNEITAPGPIPITNKFTKKEQREILSLVGQRVVRGFSKKLQKRIDSYGVR
jgi:hypothetical protein